jgi:hypothetical protein
MTSLNLIFPDSRFFSLETYFSNVDPGKMEEKFTKMREVFIKDKIMYKKLSHILHMCHGLGYSKKSMNPIFQFPYFPL